MDIYFHIFLSRWIACADVATRNTFLMDKSMSSQNVATMRKKLKMLFSESFTLTHPTTSRTNIHVFQPIWIRPALLSQILKKFFWGRPLKCLVVSNFENFFWAYSKIFVVSNFENFFGRTPKFFVVSNVRSEIQVSCKFRRHAVGGSGL